jgi:RNA polymerase sigma-70 factor, ECF subfamily
VALITDLDDRALVEQHRAGDDDAFRQIVLRHHRAMYGNAMRRLGDPTLAEDAVQEAFLRAFRNLDRFDGDYHLDAWLHRIVTNTCHDIGRRQGRDTRLFDRACTTVEVEAPAADEEVGVDVGTDVTSALDRLPATYREVLVLRFVEDLSYHDLAEKAGISEENARARVSRGRNMLKRMLTSTSALVVWAIPPLRRAQVPADPDAATQAASQVHQVANAVSAAAPSVHGTPGLNQLTNLVVHAGPTIATAAPAASSSAPVLKAAVAAGLAAAVVIPTGVAVERLQKPPRHPVAPLVVEDVEAAAPASPAEAVPRSTTTKPAATSTSAVSAQVGALGAGDGLISGVTDSTGTESETENLTESTATSEPAPTSSVPDTSDTGSSPSAPPPPAAEEPAPVEEQPPAPAPDPGRFSAEGLDVTESGPRLELDGKFRLVVGDQTFTGTLAGRIEIGEPDARDPSAARTVGLTRIALTFDDGRTATLLFSGTTVVSQQGNTRIHDLVLKFRLEGGSDLGVAESGDLGGQLVVRGSSGSLALELPGARS